MFYVSVVVATVEGLEELHEVYPEIVVRHPSIFGIPKLYTELIQTADEWKY